METRLGINLQARLMYSSYPEVVFNVEFLLVEHGVSEHEYEEDGGAGGEALHTSEPAPVGPGRHRQPDVIVRHLVTVPARQVNRCLTSGVSMILRWGGGAQALRGGTNDFPKTLHEIVNGSANVRRPLTPISIIAMQFISDFNI